MHPYATPEQSTQFASDRIRRLRVEASSWRQARRSAGSTRVTRDPAA